MPTAPSALDLGFDGDESAGWVRTQQGRQIRFRLLRTLEDLLHAERLQEEVFGVSERDLIPANELIVVAETGGAVIAAFLAGQLDRPAGVLVGWGGYVRRPRIVSDFLAVRPEARNLGLAAELKRLQAAIAFERGFEEIVWTVDPLRAANARLNFGKLGAMSREYEIDRYGCEFAAGLYGGMPSDRLHVTWEIHSSRVIDRLLNQHETPSPSDTPIPNFVSGMTLDVARIEIPTDIDALIAERPEEALAWRMRIRKDVMQAFGDGFAITGFQRGDRQSGPAYILERSRSPQS